MTDQQLPQCQPVAGLIKNGFQTFFADSCLRRKGLPADMLTPDDGKQISFHPEKFHIAAAGNHDGSSFAS